MFITTMAIYALVINVIVKELINSTIDEKVKERFFKIIDLLKVNGHMVKEVSVKKILLQSIP